MKKRIGVVVLVLLLLLLAGAGAGFYYYYSKYINIDAIYPGEIGRASCRERV